MVQCEEYEEYGEYWYASEFYACRVSGDWERSLSVLKAMQRQRLSPAILDLAVILRTCKEARAWTAVDQLVCELRKKSQVPLRICDEATAEAAGLGPLAPPKFVARVEFVKEVRKLDYTDATVALHKQFHDDQVNYAFEHIDEIYATREVDRHLLEHESDRNAIQQRARARLKNAAQPPSSEDLFQVDFSSTQEPQRFCDMEGLDPGEHVYVVSLARRPTKRLRAMQQLQAANLRAFIVDAVDGDAVLSQADITDCGARVMPNYVGHTIHKMPYTTGEVGCFLSHWGIYEKIARDNIPAALIFEDDFDIIGTPGKGRAAFKEQLGQRLKEAYEVDPGWDMLYVGHSPLEDDICRPSEFLTKPGYAVWTVAYVLRRSGALKLLAADGVRNMGGLDAYLAVMRGAPVSDPPTQHTRALEWCSHIPGAREGELRGLSCHPPLVMPFAGAQYFSDTARSRKNTRFVRNLPTGGAPCVLEDDAVEWFWKSNPPPSTPRDKEP